MSAPTREAILNLYNSTLKTSRSFSSYNFRQYFIQRTQSNFRAIQVRSPAACLTPPLLTQRGRTRRTRRS
jgi:hypothetical protein